ncbi:MAG TPA: VOC family protein [Gammaproteobacteria bacterium]|nr:VOC family protein [Gammaproteobacteria bacterium]
MSLTMLEAIRIRKLDHVVVRAQDIEKMIAFYCDVLGCSLERRSTMVPGLIHLRVGDSLSDIMAGGNELEIPPGNAGNMDHLCIQIEAFSEAGITEYLTRHRAEVGTFSQRFGADGDGTSVYIRDPEGNEVELKSAPQQATPAQ